MPTALVLDNTVSDAEALSRILAALKLEPLIAVDEAAAGAAMARRSPDILFLTWETSSRFLTDCRSRWPQTPVVVVTGQLDVRLVSSPATQLGAKGFLSKPVDAEDVRAYVSELVGLHGDPLADDIRRISEATFGPPMNRAKWVGSSPAFFEMLRGVVLALQDEQSNVLITGESGTGKELVAKAIHYLGSRAAKPFEAANAATIAKDTAEATVFGAEKGAYTGSLSMQIGLFELARDGTVFLDEIGDLDVHLQVKLLRAVQERRFRRLGGSKDIEFRARLVCATNRDLRSDIAHGRFRNDLFQRLAQRTIHVPPLRDRKDDINLLVAHFIREQAAGRDVELAGSAAAALRGYDFPGNIRELESVVKRAIKDNPHVEKLRIEHFHFQPVEAEVPDSTEDQDERVKPSAPAAEGGNDALANPEWLAMPHKQATENLVRAFNRIYLPLRFRKSGYNVTKAARDCGMDPKTFRSHWKDCGLEPLAGQPAEGRLEGERD